MFYPSLWDFPMFYPSYLLWLILIRRYSLILVNKTFKIVFILLIIHVMKFSFSIIYIFVVTIFFTEIWKTQMHNSVPCGNTVDRLTNAWSSSCDGSSLGYVSFINIFAVFSRMTAWICPFLSAVFQLWGKFPKVILNTPWTLRRLFLD